MTCPPTAPKASTSSALRLPVTVRVIRRCRTALIWWEIVAIGSLIGCSCLMIYSVGETRREREDWHHTAQQSNQAWSHTVDICDGERTRQDLALTTCQQELNRAQSTTRETTQRWLKIESYCQSHPFNPACHQL